MDKEMGDVIRKIDTTRKNQMQILKLQNSKIRFKTLKVWTLQKKRSSNLKTDQ